MKPAVAPVGRFMKLTAGTFSVEFLIISRGFLSDQRLPGVRFPPPFSQFTTNVQELVTKTRMKISLSLFFFFTDFTHFSGCRQKKWPISEAHLNSSSSLVFRETVAHIVTQEKTSDSSGAFSYYLFAGGKITAFSLNVVGLQAERRNI